MTADQTIYVVRRTSILETTPRKYLQWRLNTAHGLTDQAITRIWSAHVARYHLTIASDQAQAFALMQ